MVAHQHPGVNPPATSGRRLAKSSQKGLSIFVVLEDVLPPIAAAHHVVNRAFKFNLFGSDSPPLAA